MEMLIENTMSFECDESEKGLRRYETPVMIVKHIIFSDIITDSGTTQNGDSFYTDEFEGIPLI